MALGVFQSNSAVPQDDQSWLVNRLTDGVSTVTLDLTTFLVSDTAKESLYFASLTDEDTIAYLKSGIPLALITATNKYGPYDADATDGRAAAVSGFLESQLPIEFTRTGVKGGDDLEAGMRYMAVIDKSNLPVIPAA